MVRVSFSRNHPPSVHLIYVKYNDDNIRLYELPNLLEAMFQVKFKSLPGNLTSSCVDFSIEVWEPPERVSFGRWDRLVGLEWMKPSRGCARGWGERRDGDNEICLFLRLGSFFVYQQRNGLVLRTYLTHDPA